jgi:hypothetical protein
MNMKMRYRLFLRRKSVYYAFDDATKTFTSLKTKDKAQAERLLMAMNEAGKQPAMNLSLARVYLRHSDPMVSTRTWQNVLDEIIALKSGPTQARWKTAAKDKAFDQIRERVLIETQAEHLLTVLRSGTVSTNAFAKGPQLRGGYELASRHRHSSPAMASHPLQGKTRHHLRGTPEDHSRRAEPGAQDAVSIVQASGRESGRYRQLEGRGRGLDERHRKFYTEENRCASACPLGHRGVEFA